MSQIFNTNNPGIGDVGGVTLEEGVILAELASLSYSPGDILYIDASNNFQRLPIGTNTYVLTSNGSLPVWAAPSGGGGGGVTDGDKGDITVSGSGTVWSIDPSITLTTPRFADLGYIADQNGNKMLAFNSVASAVNYLEIQNSSTGTAVHIRALGSDADVGLHLVAKGSGGYVNITDSVDETKRIRFDVSTNTTGIVTTIRTNSTAARTADFPDASGIVMYRNNTETVQNKTLDLASNTITGTKANYNTSLTDGDFMFVGDTPTAHTHTAANITDFDEAVEDKIGTKIIAGTNVTVTYNDATGNTTINATGGSGGVSETTALYYAVAF